MQKLEREVGAPLFVRSRGGVRLTPAGELCKSYAGEVLARHRQLLEEVQGAERGLEGELRIAASTTPSEILVPRLVAGFTQLHPKVQAVVITSDSEVAADEVLARRCDLGFVGARIHRRGIHLDPVAEDEVVLAVPSGHPFASAGYVSLEAMAGERFIEREGGSGTLMTVRRILAERGLELPPRSASMVLSTTQGVISAVRDGYGIGFVSSLALRGYDGRVVPVRLHEVSLRRTLYLARAEHDSLSRLASHFAEYVLNQPKGG